MQAYTILHEDVKSTTKQLNNLRVKHNKEWLLITITITNTQHIVLKSCDTWIERIEYRSDDIISMKYSNNMGSSIKDYKAYLSNYLQVVTLLDS